MYCCIIDMFDCKNQLRYSRELSPCEPCPLSVSPGQPAGGLLHRADLAETREALVEPEVLPACVRAEVAHPAMDDLVRDDVKRGAFFFYVSL